MDSLSRHKLEAAGFTVSYAYSTREAEARAAAERAQQLQAEREQVASEAAAQDRARADRHAEAAAYLAPAVARGADEFHAARRDLGDAADALVDASRLSAALEGLRERLRAWNAAANEQLAHEAWGARARAEADAAHAAATSEPGTSSRAVAELRSMFARPMGEVGLLRSLDSLQREYNVPPSDCSVAVLVGDNPVVIAAINRHRQVLGLGPLATVGAPVSKAGLWD
jgi:hypothetical protein